jgi:hypothetical protein
MTSACWRGDRIAASLLASVHTELAQAQHSTGLAVSLFPTAPPTIGCAPCKSYPAPIAGQYSAAPCRPTALELTDSEKVWPTRRCSPSMSRRQAAALPAACLPTWPCFESLRAGTATQTHKSASVGSMATGKQYHSLLVPMLHGRPPSAQGPRYNSPGELSRDKGHRGA